MNEEQMKAEREAFEAWYVTDCKESAGLNITKDEVSGLRGSHGDYRERAALHGKWVGWQARAALSASPAPSGEVEAVEVVGYRVSMPDEPELGHWLDEKAEEEPQIQHHEPLMTVAQHQRIVAEKEAEIARLIGVCASLDSEKRDIEHKWDAVKHERDELRAQMKKLEFQSHVHLCRVKTAEAQLAAQPAAVPEPMAEVGSDGVFFLRKQPNGQPWPRGTKLYTAPAAPQQVDLVRDLVAIIDEELLPNIGHLAIQDYARLNDTLGRARLNADRSAQGGE